jgi:TolB-like protein
MNIRIFLILGFIIEMFIAGMAYASRDNLKETIAIFPFENFSEDNKALEVVIPMVKSRLEAKGYTVLKENEMNVFLLKERIRNAGCVSKDTAMKIGNELKVNMILTGAVSTFSGGDHPRAGFMACLINTADGSIIWANHAAAYGEDFESILGIGKIGSLNKLSERVLDILFGSFTAKPAEKHPESLYRIAVMPFQNKSKTRDAGIMVTYMFIAELFKNKNFMPVEYGEVRRLIIDLRLREKGEIDLKNTEAVAGSAGVDGIILGSVDVYREGSGITDPSEVEISARLINARKGEILWYNGSLVKGDDSVVMLDWGRILSTENVAYKAITKLVKEMGKVKWR